MQNFYNQMTINFTELKKQAAKIDTYQFTKHNKSFGKPSPKAFTPDFTQLDKDFLDLDTYEQNLSFSGLSKQAKIKLLSKDQ